MNAIKEVIACLKDHPNIQPTEEYRHTIAQFMSEEQMKDQEKRYFDVHLET